MNKSEIKATRKKGYKKVKQEVIDKVGKEEFERLEKLSIDVRDMIMDEVISAVNFAAEKTHADDNADKLIDLATYCVVTRLAPLVKSIGDENREVISMIVNDCMKAYVSSPKFLMEILGHKLQENK